MKYFILFPNFSVVSADYELSVLGICTQHLYHSLLCSREVSIVAFGPSFCGSGVCRGVDSLDLRVTPPCSARKISNFLFISFLMSSSILFSCSAKHIQPPSTPCLLVL